VEILAVLLNGLLLFGVVAYILYQAYQRLLSQPEVLSLPMLFVAVAGLLANIASGIVLKKASEESLNVRIVYVHVWTDALQSVGVIIAAFVMLFTGWFLADPIVSIVIALFIYWTGWRIARAAVKVLLESAPRHVDVESLRQRMLQVEGVANVHDIHAWSITTGYEVLSAHVVMTNPRHVDRNSLLNRLRDVARKEFKIDHITIQLEETAAKCQEAHAQ
jgi:cobalt-zinc-cadmium efflux system protein